MFLPGRVIKSLDRFQLVLWAVPWVRFKRFREGPLSGIYEWSLRIGFLEIRRWAKCWEAAQ